MIKNGEKRPTTEHFLAFIFKKKTVRDNMMSGSLSTADVTLVSIMSHIPCRINFVNSANHNAIIISEFQAGLPPNGFSRLFQTRSRNYRHASQRSL